ncbi:LrgB family protein [Seohaeicola sp. SP36]|jgi:predicted murein hydrolase (TIGR00659 family)|uniref:LrgB family protein n=1 Tax=unclassified Seohaeicola TaxID=2641111 RepID=UPI00237BD3B9|nr:MULTISPECIES: LrgB family protein [unclassified Seohaeicola]MDD9708908.1 LrgB family protein [Seohaeicola sp. 4SK31]MDD9736994.1 LrgB family protein [Seohaeicola sp. SP36]
MTALPEIWSYLSREPLLWLTATLVAYLIGDQLSQRAGRNPLVNPVLVAMVLLGGLLWVTKTPYQTYFAGAQFVHFMLGPATVALALPLYVNRAQIRRALLPMVAALLAGSVTAIVSALWIARVLGIEGPVWLSLAPKSTTAPVAIGIAEQLGGLPTLTAALVILTGIIGAVIVTPLMRLMHIRDWRARGFAVGVAAHGIGTARAFQVNDTAGAFAGIGMGLNALLTAILAPYVVSLML